jgi:ABC-type nitrate/sulfonate/bicarbonate transport system substrate-binding protein
MISNSYFPIIAAVDLGLMKAEGIDATVDLLFPVPKTMEALRDGDLDFVAGAAHATLQAFTDWQGAKLLAALAQRMYWLLVLRADLGARRGDLQAVKGLRIGAAPGPDLGLRRLLTEVGIDPDQDVQIGPVPGTSEASVSFGVTAAKALEEGRLDGFWANAMGAEVAVRRGIGTIVLDVRRGEGPEVGWWYTFPAFVTTEKLVKEQPEVVAGAVRALVKAQQALRDDPSRATEVARNRFPAMETDLIADLIRRDLPYYDATISEAMVSNLNQFAEHMGLLSHPVAYDQIVATQFSHLWKRP